MRGFEPEDVVKKSMGRITMEDLYPYMYPSDDEIEKTGVRGIYLSNFFFWNAKSHAELMIDKWDFSPVRFQRDRTFNLYAKIEDHANDIHDYLKFLKFGYGRATDDASMEIRHGRMTREDGIEMVRQYDANEPETLRTYLDFLELSGDQFYDIIEQMRDLQIWEKTNHEWKMKDHVTNHIRNEFTEGSRVDQVDDRTFSEPNRNLYYNDKFPPIKKGDERVDVKKMKFKIL
jgi:hypothetical protein